MKLTAGVAVVVACIVLAGCGSGGQATSPSNTPATGGVVPYTEDSTPASIAEPTVTTTTLDLTEQCSRLLSPADSTGVPAAIQAQVIVSTAAKFPGVVPPFQPTAVDTLNTYMQDALSVADQQLLAPVSTIAEQVGYVLTAVTQSQTVDPSTSEATITAAVSQVKAVCQRVGVVVPAS